MAFVKKTWEDRDSEYPNRRSLTDPTTGTTEIRDIGLAEGDVYVEGTPLKASEWNDLEQRIEDAIDEIPITEVEVTPVVTEGENLATIRVNEDTSEIKMPKPFEVKITYASGEYTADKTVAEIYAAAENGYEVYALYGMEMFDLAGYSRSSASFINVTNIASSKTSTIRSFVIRSNNTTTYDTKILYNLPSITGSSSVGRLMTVISAGGENRYSLTTDNTIDDAHTNAKRTYSSQKVNAELQARDAEIALKANTADVDAALALKADKADTYTKSQVDTALSAKANTADVTASLALKADKADTYTKTEVDTALGLKADKETTYTKSEVDTALALKADEADLPTKTSDLTNDSDYQTGDEVSQAVSEAVENKADTDGTYEDMTVGTAMKLVATRHTTDTAPYLFRQSGGDNNAYVGTEETDKLVGASAVVNQLVQNGNMSDGTTGWTPFNTGNTAISAQNNEMVCTISVVTSSVYGNAIRTAYQLAGGHVYYSRYKIYVEKPSIANIGYIGSADRRDLNIGAGYSVIGGIAKPSGASYAYFGLSQPSVSGYEVNDTYKITNMNIFDLTAMFGTVIADYVYSLEQATAGSGIAYLRKYGFFTKDYYPYQTNALQSVNTSKHITVGKNLLDYTLLTWTDGLRDDDGNPTASTASHYSSEIKVLPNTTYTVTDLGTGSTAYRIYFLTNQKEWISRSVQTSATSYTFTTPINCGYIQLQTRIALFAENTQIEFGSTATAYEPYVKHEYALPNIDLRGLYKLDAGNNLYADGDSLTGDGTLTHNRGRLTIDGTNVKVYGVQGAVANGYAVYIRTTDYGMKNRSALISDKFIYVVQGYNNMPVMSFGGTSGPTATVWFILPSTVTSKNEADAWFASNPTTIEFELETPTTETATGFTNPQTVSKYGTEEYTDERDFPMPVGHETDYSLDSEMPMPVPPITAGTYNLQLTVDASGNQTYSWAT